MDRPFLGHEKLGLLIPSNEGDEDATEAKWSFRVIDWIKKPLK